MQCDQSIGLELPLKIMVSTNLKGQTSITYKTPQHYNYQFDLGDCVEVINKMEGMFNTLTKEIS